MAVGGVAAVLELASPASGRIFISYRREDTGGRLLALMPPLRERFGAARIFKDTDNIGAGDDFVEALQRELTSCSVMLVVIGRDWLTIQDARLGPRRLDNPEDFVRIEIATALQSKQVLVVPVLVGGASMPSPDDLPSNLRALARRQAIVLTDTHWDADIGNLIKVIEAACGEGIREKRVRALRRGLAAVAAMLLIAAAAIWSWGRVTGERALTPPAQSLPGSNQQPVDPVARPQPADSAPAGDSRLPSAGERKPASPDAADTPGPRPEESKRPAGPPARPSPSRNAEASRSRARPPAETTGTTPPAATSGSPKEVDAEPRSLPAAASAHDAAAGAAIKPGEDRPVDPPAAPARPAAPPDEAGAGTRAHGAVEQALERFRAAYSQKDKGALLAVFPGVQADKLFADLEVCARVSLSFSEMTVGLLSATEALVDVKSTYGCRPKTGQREQTSKPVRDTFRLTQKGTEWVISRRLITLDGC